MSSKLTSLSAYRSLLRASRLVFNGDTRTLNLSLRQIRTEFEKNRFEKDEKKIQKLISDAQEASSFLISSVLQGVKEQDGFKIRLNKKQVEANLDANVTIKGIDDQYLENLERRAGRKKNRGENSADETAVEQQQQPSTESSCCKSSSQPASN
ncbi:hypothetical protein C9374_011946 [Naegleria lovaniensis]|uniref:Complex 1 LYR protein domain-containing protein n=1 Tax=Naegleria lovaniensis TaxID=51637 RepID=A0AA88KI91_NAELO|nr:uncharacterized protein C9374_011946 [Naegleria lovaniensis]KAG2373657.1 hypothetical protein C9374_011946 [Naegleria lovaniensis]